MRISRAVSPPGAHLAATRVTIFRRRKMARDKFARRFWLNFNGVRDVIGGCVLGQSINTRARVFLPWHPKRRK